MSDKCPPFFVNRSPPSLPNGYDCRELAVKIREIARQTRLPFARRELLRLATRYQRRGNHLDGTNSMSGPLATPRVSLFSAVVSGALCLVMFAGPASANTIDPPADTMEIASQGMRSVTGEIFSQGMQAESGPWAGETYSQGMRMTTGDIYSQGMEITFLGGTTYSPSPGDVGSPNWSDDATNLGGTTNSPPSTQGCIASSCSSNGNSANMQTTSESPKHEDTSPSNLSSMSTGGTPDHDSIPELYITSNENIAMSGSLFNESIDNVVLTQVQAATVPEPSSLALLGPALLWVGLVRRRRDAEAPSWS